MKLMRTIDNDLLNLELVERFAVYGDEKDEAVEIRAYTTDSCYTVWKFALSPADVDLDFNTAVVDKIKHIELPKLADWIRNNKSGDWLDCFNLWN